MPLVTPGEILQEGFMAPFGLPANALGLERHVPPNRIQAIVKGKRAIAAVTALRLSHYFGNSPEFWLNLQQIYDFDATKRDKLAEIQSQIARRHCRRIGSKTKHAERAEIVGVFLFVHKPHRSVAYQHGEFIYGRSEWQLSDCYFVWLGMRWVWVDTTPSSACI
jgi:antitoxin HigA-1